MRDRVYAVQAAYYLVTGVWPLASMRSFTAVTGPKTDLWLVRMVALLAAANGAALLTAARARDRGQTPFVLALASAFAFAAIDITYVARRQLRPVYLGDAVAELAFAVALLATDGGDRPPS